MVDFTSSRVVKGPAKSLAPTVKPRLGVRRLVAGGGPAAPQTDAGPSGDTAAPSAPSRDGLASPTPAADPPRATPVGGGGGVRAASFADPETAGEDHAAQQHPLAEPQPPESQCTDPQPPAQPPAGEQPREQQPPPSSADAPPAPASSTVPPQQLKPIKVLGMRTIGRPTIRPSAKPAAKPAAAAAAPPPTDSAETSRPGSPVRERSQSVAPQQVDPPAALERPSAAASTPEAAPYGSPKRPEHAAVSLPRVVSSPARVMPPPIRVTIPNSSLSRAESPPAPQATQLAASLQTLVQPEDEEHIYHDVFDTDLDMYGTQSSVATMHRIPQRVNAPPIVRSLSGRSQPRNAKPAAASADAHEGEDQRDSIHQRTASATRRRSLSPLRSPLATSSGMYLPPLIRRPFGVADIASLSMNDLVGNELIDGRISKAEEARRQLVKESRKRRRPGSVPETASPAAPDTASSSQSEVAPAPTPTGGPRVQFVNGQIQIDATSLLVQAPNENVEELQRVDEAAQRYVTSSSFRQRPKLRKVEWTTQMTKRFYDGLSYFGTDFYLIALMFPSLDRDHIKRKFNNEDQASVTRALKQRRIPPEELRTRMMSYITEKKKLHAARFPSQYKPDEDYPVGHSSAASASTSPAAADAPRADRNTRATTATPEPDDAGVVAKISDADTQPNAGSTSAEPNKENDELVIPRALSHLDLTQTSKRQLNSAVRPRIGPVARARRPRPAAPAPAPESAREDGDAGQVPSEHDAPVESANGSGPSAIDVDEPVSAPAASRPAGKPIVRRVGGISIRTPAMQRMAGSEAVSAQPSQAAAQE